MNDSILHHQKPRDFNYSGVENKNICPCVRCWCDRVMTNVYTNSDFNLRFEKSRNT